MRADADRWNRRYRAGREQVPPSPDELLVRLQHRLPGRGWALDVACGRGHNSIFLAALGYRVVGVDVSIEGMRGASALAREHGLAVDFVVADLDRMSPPPGCFDAVVVIKYLNRELVPRLRSWVCPGGLVFYRTFNVNHLQRMPSFNSQYVLEPGELVHLFRGFEVIATNDNHLVREPMSYLVARRPRSPPGERAMEGPPAEGGRQLWSGGLGLTGTAGPE